MSHNAATNIQRAPLPEPEHHPIFSEYDSFEGPVSGDFDIDFIGALTRKKYFSTTESDPTKLTIRKACFPAFDEEYFEWVDLLETVAEAGEEYVFCELGAGYGRWAGRAYLAAKRKEVSKIKLITVEGEPVHSAWLQEHLTEQGVQPSELDHFECAIGDKTGTTNFYVCPPKAESGLTPATWYGQSRAPKSHNLSEHHTGETYHGKPVTRSRCGYGWIEVPQVRALELLGRYQFIDLIDMDVQGEEANVVADAITHLNDHVKRLHIGTHSQEIEISLRKTLSVNGWDCIRDYPSGSASETPYGTIKFQDGVQTWINPRTLSKNTTRA